MFDKTASYDAKTSLAVLHNQAITPQYCLGPEGTYRKHKKDSTGLYVHSDSGTHFDGESPSNTLILDTLIQKLENSKSIDDTMQKLIKEFGRFSDLIHASHTGDKSIEKELRNKDIKTKYHTQKVMESLVGVMKYKVLFVEYGPEEGIIFRDSFGQYGIGSIKANNNRLEVSMTRGLGFSENNIVLMQYSGTEDARFCLTPDGQYRNDYCLHLYQKELQLRLVFDEPKQGFNCKIKISHGTTDAHRPCYEGVE